MIEIMLQAHMGVSTECPMNTMPAIMTAIEQGYGVIEFDLMFTKDKQIVLSHDKTINRCARKPDGSRIFDEIYISDLTYEELLEFDFGISFSPKFKGTKIPLFTDVLKRAKETEVKLKIDNKFERFSQEDKEILFSLIKDYEDIANLTVTSVESALEVKKYFKNPSIHFDGDVTEEVLQELSNLFDREKLIVWTSVVSPKTWWAKRKMSIEESSVMIKKYAKLGVWIISNDKEFEIAKRVDADIIETNGEIKPIKNVGIVSDMHSHSKNSHDSECNIIDSAKSKADAGIDIFAVTDHIDVEFYKEIDIYEIANNSKMDVLNVNHQSPIPIIYGLEMGEAFWYPDVAMDILSKFKPDVVIGSVHAVRYEGYTYPFSQIDFSKFTDIQIYEYMKQYIEDYEYMVRYTDYDIAAHLTCPLRYINGKYKRNFDIMIFMDRIEEILKILITKGKALEVNVSSVDILNDYMPTEYILKLYKKLGGYLITTGSDTHVAKNDGNVFKDLYKKLFELGFKNTYYYKNRTAYQCKIGEK